LIAPTILL